MKLKELIKEWCPGPAFPQHYFVLPPAATDDEPQPWSEQERSHWAQCHCEKEKKKTASSSPQEKDSEIFEQTSTLTSKLSLN